MVVIVTQGGARRLLWYIIWPEGCGQRTIKTRRACWTFQSKAIGINMEFDNSFNCSGKLSTRIWSVSGRMCARSVKRAFVRSDTDVLAHYQYSSSSQRCSLGLRSGLCAGQWSSSTHRFECADAVSPLDISQVWYRKNDGVFSSFICEVECTTSTYSLSLKYWKKYI